MKKLKLLLATLALLGGVNSVNAQKDVTSQYITNATLSEGTASNNTLTGWTTTNFNDGPTGGNNTSGKAIESYAGWGSVERATFSLTQNITLPAGNYRLVNYSFYRYGESFNTDATISEAYLKAGDNQVLVKTLGSITGQQSYANGMADAANRFETKMYRNVLEFTIATDNTTIEIGITGTHSEPKSWFICGMFELFDLDDEASVSSPTDMTYAITNPGFEYLNWTGWTNEGFNLITNNDNIGGKSGVAYIEYYKWGGLENNKYISQTLTGLDNGLYEVTVFGHQQQGTPNDGVKLYANSDYTYIGSTTQDYSVRTTVSNNELIIKIQTEGSTANWTAFDKFRLKFYGDPLKAYQDLLDAAVNTAQALIDGAAGSAISAAAKAAWQAVVDANDNDDKAFTEESDFNTAIANIEAANTNYQTMAAPYASFNALKTAANAIAAVDYKETTDGSHNTFANAITAQTKAADDATSAADITAATNALIAAIKTYIAGAEPANDGEYFDITCLMVNPNFDDSHNGWSYLSAPGVNWSNCEYYESEFDINQTVTGLPTGSYSLSVQAFQRPGWAGDVYNEYISGTDNASSVLYINSITSNVKNIAADAQDTYKLGDGSSFAWPNDSRVGEEGSYKYVPNSQQGANLYFAAGLYDATCAAVVDDAANGSLKLGFKSTKTHVGGDWTIFDNFRLYYYGSSLLIYYKQYLPQLKTEAGADLANALYANVTGKEKNDFETALAATPASETEAAYKAVIDDITEKQTAFRAAAASYDALVAAKAYIALTEITVNIGSGTFQYPTNTTTLWSTYSSAKNAVDGYNVSATSTAAEIQDLVDALDDAIEAYEGITLNEPAVGQKFTVSMANGSWEYTKDNINYTLDNEAITYLAGAREDMGGYNVSYAAVSNPNLAQAFTFTKVSGNNYKLSQLDADGNERYLSTGTAYEGGNSSQIRTTTDADKAMEVTVIPTNEEGFYNLKNVEANALLGAQDAGVFTVNSHNKYTIAEASQASVAVSIAEGVKWGTRIFPFNPSLTGVIFYSCSAVNGDILTLTEVEEPKADTPYILYAESGLESTDLSGWGVLANEEAKTVGYLTGVYTDTDAPVGSYVLQKNDNEKVAFYVVAENEQPTVGANRCYLTWPQAGARAFYFPENNATAIKTINALTSGKAEIFNASGVQIPALQKGMNIIRTADGKSQKVMVK